VTERLLFFFLAAACSLHRTSLPFLAHNPSTKEAGFLDKSTSDF